MFGFAASFADSVVLITDVQLIEPAYIETSTKFLYDRSLYSLQLQNFCEEKLNMPRTTCAVFFGTKRKSVEKIKEKVRKRYLKSNIVSVQTLTEFKFYPEEWTEHEMTE